MHFAVIILSKNVANLQACVRSIMENEPTLPPERIIVVDDCPDNAIAEFATESGITPVLGMSPFVYARNANIGLRYAFDSGADAVILLNDDTRLQTGAGFSMLADLAIMSECSGSKVAVAPSLTGAVGNSSQVHRPGQSLRPEPRMLCFVAICITRQAWQDVGPLDERFTGYGLDDDDWCLRARKAGYGLWVWDGCTVEHGKLPSSFRSGNGSGDYRPNLKLFIEKWGVDNWGRKSA